MSGPPKRADLPLLSGDLQRVERNPDDGRVYGFEVDSGVAVRSEEFFRRYAADFRLGADDALVEYAHEYAAPDLIIRRYDQRYKNLPVFGGGYFLHERNGRVERGHGDTIPGIDLDVVPAIDEPSAFSTVLAALDLDEKDLVGDPPAARPIGALGIAKSSDPGGTFELIYRFQLGTRSKVVDVDARSGRIARTFDSSARMENFPTMGQGDLGIGLPRSLRVKGQGNPDCTATYFLSQKGNGTSLPDINVKLADYKEDAYGEPDQAAIVASAKDISETVGGGGSPQLAEDGSDSARSEDADASKASAKNPGPPPAPCTLFVPPDFMNVPSDWHGPIDVLANLEAIHDYLFAHFKSPGDPAGTMGYIGADGTTPLSYNVYYVYKIFDSRNWWNHDILLSFSYGNLMTTDAHEFGHSVFDAANGVGKNYHSEDEAANLNEAFADIFSTVLDVRNFPTHTLLEPDDHYGDGSGLVDMIDPPLSHSGRFASSYHDAYWVSIPPGVPCTPKNDYCGVHMNGGPAEHWFALLVGGQRNGKNFGIGVNTLGRPFNVFGLGLDDAEKIAFQTMRELGPQPTYMGARAASLAVASSLFPSLASGVDSPQYISVMDAWSAVGVGPGYGADWDETYGEGVKRIVDDADPWPYRSWIVAKYPYVGVFDFTLSDDSAFPPGRVVTASANTDAKGNAYADFNLDTGQTYYISALPTTGNSYCLVNATTQAFCDWMLQNAEASGIEIVTAGDNAFALNSPAQGGASVYPWNTTFGWSAPPSPKANIPLAQPIKYLLQIAADSDVDFVHPFHTAVITASGSPSGETLTLPILTNKDQRWRVVAVGPNDAIDNQPTFALPKEDSNAFNTAKVATTLASPATGTHVPPWGAPLALTWLGNQGAVSYDVCIGDNAMPEGTCSLPYSGVTALVPNLDTAGCGALDNGKKCFWTVAPRGPALFGNEPAEIVDPSPRGLLVVDYGLLKKPVLSTASPTYTYDTDPGATVGFTWNALPGADHHVIKVTKPNNQPPFSSPPIAGNKTSYNLFGVRNVLGSLGATITAYGPAPDNIPIASAPVTYQVTLAKPVIHTPGPNLVYPYLYVPDGPISWTSVEGADHYQLMIQDPDGIVTAKAVAASAQLTVGNAVYQSDGTKPPTDKTGAAGYKVWVSAEGPVGSGVSVASAAVTYLIGPRNPMGLEGTLDAASAPALNAPYVLHWTNETPGATYRLQVRDITVSPWEDVLDQTNIGAASWNVNTFLKPARKYMWDVVADLNGRKSSWSAMRYFTTGGSCVSAIGQTALSPLNFHGNHAGTRDDPYVIGSTGNQIVFNGTLSLYAVPEAIDYRVGGAGTDGTLSFPNMTMTGNGFNVVQGYVAPEVEYYVFAQAKDKYGCWTLPSQLSQFYYIKWTQ